VGTIGDLRTWIARSKDDLRFFVKDVFLLLLSLIVSFGLFLYERYTAKVPQQDDRKENPLVDAPARVSSFCSSSATLTSVLSELPEY